MRAAGTWLASDLDNTLIHSHRHRQEGDLCVEWLDGKEQSFMTKASARLLSELHRHVTLLAVTTRSLEQYRRIRWPEGCTPDYAVTTNGAILLCAGKEDSSWSREMQEACSPFQKELDEKCLYFQEQSESFRCRIVDNAYLFLYSIEAEVSESFIKGLNKETSLNVEGNGRKIYFLPPQLDKGKALKKIRQRFSPNRVLAAGDSRMDLPMLQEADAAFVPHGYAWENKAFLRQPADAPVFSDWFLGRISEDLHRIE